MKPSWATWTDPIYPSTNHILNYLFNLTLMSYSSWIIQMKQNPKSELRILELLIILFKIFCIKTHIQIVYALIRTNWANPKINLETRNKNTYAKPMLKRAKGLLLYLINKLRCVVSLFSVVILWKKRKYGYLWRGTIQWNKHKTDLKWVNIARNKYDIYGKICKMT